MIGANNLSENTKVCFVVNLPAESRVGSDLESGSIFVSGGAELQCYLIGKQLALDGWDIAYISLQPITLSEKAFRAYYAKSRLGGDGVLARYIRALSLFGLLKEINPDVVVTTHYGSLNGFVALYCSLYRKKMLYRAASILDADLSLGRNTGWSDLGFLPRCLQAVAVKRADVIVTNAEYVRAAFKQRLRRKRVCVIRNGLPMRRVRKNAGSIALWIGRLVRVKNPEVFVRLAAELPRIRFVMCGDGELYEECLREAITLPNLSVVGVVDEARKSTLLSKAFALVSTSLSEGFPNTLIEAGIHGVPYVSFVDPDEVICRNSLGFHVKSFSELVQKTRLLAEDVDLGRGMGRNIRRYVERKHRLENTVSDYAKVLTSLGGR
jgi:glycosyltransferase involved in cell wall biosynthesis